MSAEKYIPDQQIVNSNLIVKRIHSRGEWTQQIKAAQNNDGQEQSIVIEDRESSCFIVCYFVLFPQDPIIKGKNND